MAMIIGRLVAQLEAQDDGLSTSLDRAESGLKRVEGQSTRTTAAVKKASADNAAAYNRQQAAATKLIVAEQDLAKAKQSGTATSRQVLQLESRVQSARASAISASSRYSTTTRQLARSQSEAASSASQQARSTNTLNATLVKTRALLAGAGIAAGGAAFTKFFTDAISNARALGAQTNQLTVLFGENATEIQAWGKTAVDTMRMSQREAQGAAVQFAGIGKAMGLADEQLIAFSKDQTKLAADLASFQGMPVADAIEAMTGAYAGSTEVMRKYNVYLDEGTLKTAAYNNGIAATGSQLSATQKQQAMYFAMQEQLSHVAGDVERSNGKYGASLKTLQARFEENSAAIGQKLIPIAHAFVDLLAGPGMAALSGFGDVLGVAANLVGTLASAFGSLPAPIQTALAGIVAFRLAQRLLGDQMGAVKGRLTDAVSSFRSLGQTVTLTTAQGQVQMGRFGSSIAGIGRHVPTVARMQQAFVNAAIGAERFPRSAGAASAAMVGMRGAASGLMGALGGPWGLAITGATALLGLWISKKQQDAQASQEAETRTDSYADSLRKSGGVITEALREQVAGSYDEAREGADKLGISQRELSDAMVLGGNSAKSLIRILDELIVANQKTGDVRQEDYWNRDMYNETGVAALNMKDAIQNANEHMDGARTKARQVAEATGDVAVSFDGTASAAGVMSEAVTEFGESTDGAATKVDKLAKALKSLYDDALTEEEALQASSEAMRDFGKTLEEVGVGSVKVGGAIDVTTEAGGKLQDSVRDIADTYADTASAAYESAERQGMSATAAQDYVAKATGPIRKNLIDQAMASGLARDRAEELANRYLGMPGEVITNLQMKGVEQAIKSLDDLQIKATNLKANVQVTDNTPQVRAKLDEIGVKYKVINGRVAIAGDDIERAQDALGELGVKTENLPGGWVQVDDNVPGVMRQLDELGIKTTKLPDGSIIIDAQDQQFWDAVRRAEAPGSKTITVYAVDQAGRPVNQNEMFGRGLGVLKNEDGSITEYANGGFRLPSSALIQKADPNGGLVQWAEPSTKGEAFIPLAEAKRARSTAILAEVAERFGYGLVPAGTSLKAFADGGVLGSLQAVQQRVAPALKLTSGVRNEPGSFHHTGQAGDFSNGSSPTDEMLAFAKHIAANYKSQTAELIYHDPRFSGQQIGDGKTVPDSYYAGAGYHGDHVHWAAKSPIVEGAEDGLAAGIADITLTQDSSREDVARKIIAEGRKRGYSDDEIQAILSTAIQESNLNPSARGAEGPWNGIFQQDSSYPGRDDPNTNITGFYDRLDEKRSSPGSSGNIYDDIFWLQQRPGDPSAQAAVSNGRSGYMSEIKGREDEASRLLSELGPSVGTGMSGDLSGLGGGASTVYVAGGHLDYIGSGGGGTDRPSGSLSPGVTTGGGRRTAPSSSSMQAARNSVENTRRKVAEATEKQRIAEMRLDEVRANPKAKASQIASAEAAVERAKNAVTTATEKQTLAEQKLAELEARATESATTPVGGGDADAEFKGLTLTSPLMRGRQPLRFRTGGTIPGSGRGDKVPLLAEPGEEMIRRDIAEQPGVRTFLKALNAGHIQRLRTGGTVGFGGHADDTSDYMRPTSWNDYAALAVGGGFTAASLIAPYVGMAQSGNWDLGNMAPTFSTGSNEVPGVSEFVGDYASQISQQLAEIAQLLAKGERVEVIIKSDESPSAASMVGMAAGV